MAEKESTFSTSKNSNEKMDFVETIAEPREKKENHADRLYLYHFSNLNIYAESVNIIRKFYYFSQYFHLEAKSIFFFKKLYKI